MATATEITCIKCLKPKLEYHAPSVSPPRICSQCEHEAKDEERTQALKAQAAKPFEQRLSELEAFMHDHKLVRHGYQQPPRF